MCDTDRTIELITLYKQSTTYQQRLKYFLLPEISDQEPGFVPSSGTREQTLNVQQIIEKAFKLNVTTYLDFLDYSKAFDSVKSNKLRTILQKMGVRQYLTI